MAYLLKPQFLKIGDTIGLVSPSAPLAGLVPHRTKRGVKMLEELGFKVKVGKYALKVTEHTAGTLHDRAKDINYFFKDEEVKAIFSFIGGNHSNQILKYLNFDLIKKNLKIFLGYSEQEKKEVVKIIQERTSDYEFPILLNANIGHSDPMITIPLGVKIEIDSSKDIFDIRENGVAKQKYE